MTPAIEADEATLVALLNSTPVVDGAPHDELGTDDSARAWLRAHGVRMPIADRAILRGGRDALQAVVRGDQPPSSLAVLLDGVVARPAIGDEGLAWTLEPTGGRAVVAQALISWDALRRSSPGRLRPCANDECALFLLDRSKSNSGRWCSMAVCGNKMKARRHYRRTRGQSA